MYHTVPYILTMQCAVVLAPVWSVTVTAYTPLSVLLYPLIWSVVSCCSTFTWTFGLAPAHLGLLPGHVASVTLWGASPVSRSRSQVTTETLSRGPIPIRAFRTRPEPGITYTGSSLRMRTDIHWSPQGTEDRSDQLLLLAHQNDARTYMPHTVCISIQMTRISHSSVLTFFWRVCLGRTGS